MRVARAKVKQAAEDLKTGKIWAEREGIAFGLVGRREPEVDEELEVIMPDMLNVVLRAIGNYFIDHLLKVKSCTSQTYTNQRL